MSQLTGLASSQGNHETTESKNEESSIGNKRPRLQIDDHSSQVESVVSSGSAQQPQPSTQHTASPNVTVSSVQAMCLLYVVT